MVSDRDAFKIALDRGKSRSPAITRSRLYYRINAWELIIPVEVTPRATLYVLWCQADRRISRWSFVCLICTMIILCNTRKFFCHLSYIGQTWSSSPKSTAKAADLPQQWIIVMQWQPSELGARRCLIIPNTWRYANLPYMDQLPTDSKTCFYIQWHIDHISAFYLV